MKVQFCNKTIEQYPNKSVTHAHKIVSCLLKWSSHFKKIQKIDSVLKIGATATLRRFNLYKFGNSTYLKGSQVYFIQRTIHRRGHLVRHFVCSHRRQLSSKQKKIQPSKQIHRRHKCWTIYNLISH